MYLQPIARRELLVASRRPGTFRLRNTAALAAAGAAAVVMLTASLTGSRHFGTQLFGFLAPLGFCIAWASGLFLTADSLSEEHREGTLGFLFLTDLAGFDVALGKWIIGVLIGVSILLAALPVLGLAWALGGVTHGEIWRIGIVWITTCIWSNSLCLAASCRFASSIPPFARALLALLAFTLIPAVIAMVLRTFGSPSAAEYIDLLSPAVGFRLSRDAAYQSGPFATNQAIQWIVSVVALIGTGMATAHAWRSPLVPSRSTAPIDAHRRWAVRKEELEKNPVTALALQDIRVTRFAWICALIVLMVQVLFCLDLIPAIPYTNPASLAFIPFKLLFAWYATQFFTQTRRDGRLEILLTTPLTDYQIIHGQVRALYHIFNLPIVTACLTSIAVPLMVKISVGKSAALMDNSAVMLGGSLFSIPTLLVDLSAIAWVGFWLSLTEERTASVFSKTVIRAILLPHLLFCIPNVVINGIQRNAMISKFHLNLRSILDGRREAWPVAMGGWKHRHDPSVKGSMRGPVT